MNAAHAGAQVICLITTPNPDQAHVWQNVLRTQGIKSQVVGDFLGSENISGIQLEIWVRHQDWIGAKRVLRQWSQSEGADGVGKHSMPASGSVMRSVACSLGR
jgi:hypothetical protein